jgi:predicted membrane-bound dolichyl-phosphate-mannose-protein mannosyltransferase
MVIVPSQKERCMRSLSPPLRTAIIVILVVVLLVAYYITHKPLTPEMLTRVSSSIGALFAEGIDPVLMATHLLGALLDIATVLALLAVCGGIGRFALRRA